MNRAKKDAIFRRAAEHRPAVGGMRPGLVLYFLRWQLANRAAENGRSARQAPRSAGSLADEANWQLRAPPKFRARHRPSARALQLQQAH
jgi:hypothetical protein